MKKILVTLFALVAILTACNGQNKNYKRLTVNDFESAIMKDNVVVLDVRTAKEYALGHLDNAINIDVLKPTFEDSATSLLPKKCTIAVYCRSGNRSQKAAQLLADKGYNVVELNTGFTGWKSANKATTREEIDLFVTREGTCIYTYCIKHGTVKMRVGNAWVYVDPVGDKILPVTDFSTMPKADYFLITHDHMDHLDTAAIRQLTKEGTVVIANESSAAKLNKQCSILHNGESKIFDKLSVNAVPAYNFTPEKEQFHPQGRDNGYVLTYEGFRILIAGDTEDISEMSELPDIDVAFLPCNMPYTMTPEQLVHAVEMVHPKVVFPYHLGQTDLNKIMLLLSSTPSEVRIRQYQ